MGKIVMWLEKKYINHVNRKWEYYKKKSKEYQFKSDWYWNVLKKENKFPVSIFNRFKLYKKGFRSDSYVKYQLDKNNIDDYLSELDRWKSRDINQDYNIIFDDKELFYYVFKDYIKTPKIIGKITRGNFIDESGQVLDFNKFITLLKKSENGLFFRVNKSGGGSEIFLIKYSDKKFLMNYKTIKKNELEKFFMNKNDYLITEVVKNASYSSKIYSKTVNTLRIVIAKKKDSDDFQVVAAAHRFGSDESIPGDNLSRGGVVAEVNIKTGIIGKATTSKITEFFNNHPDTGEKIKGVKIKNYDKIVEELIKLSQRFSFINFIAWDIVVQDNGFVIIEGNTSSGINIFQYFGGAKNKKLGAIYKSYGITK